MVKSVLRLELKKLFTKFNILVMLFVFSILALFCWEGIRDYREAISNKEVFQKLEREKVSLLIHYTYYGMRGIRLLSIPTSLSVIYNDSEVYDEMVAHVDSAEQLLISNSFKGKDLFSNTGGYMDLSGMLLIIGSFIALLYGYNINKDQSYIMMLSKIKKVRNPTFLILIARIILLSFLSWIYSLLALLFLLTNSISVVNWYYFAFIFILTAVISSFTLLGAAIGSIKRKSLKFFALASTYFLLIFFIPWSIQKIVYMEAKNNLIPIYKFEYGTFKYVIDFERDSYKKVGTWKSGKIAPDNIKALIKKSRKSVYEKIRKMESKRLERIVERIKTYQTISSIFPTTFYISFGKEISSKGYQSFLSFYKKAFDMKFDFIDFYLERKFYRELPKSGVESFIKGDENLFYSESNLPNNFGLGISILIIWIGGLSVLNWFIFDNLKQQLDIDSLKGPALLKNLNPKKDKVTAVITDDPDDYYLYLERLRTQGIRFLAVPGWETLKSQGDLKVEWIFQLYKIPVPEVLKSHLGKYINELKPEILATIYTEIAGQFREKVYIFNDFTMGLSDDFIEGYFSEFLSSIKKDAQVIFFSRSITNCQKYIDLVSTDVKKC